MQNEGMWICMNLRPPISHKYGCPLICTAIALFIYILCTCNKFGSVPALVQMWVYVDLCDFETLIVKQMWVPPHLHSYSSIYLYFMHM